MDRLFRFFAIAECRVHDANLLQVRSQATVSCSQPEYSGLLVSCQTVDWVCRGVVVSSGPSPLTVLEQGFGFLISGGGQGLPDRYSFACYWTLCVSSVGRTQSRLMVHSTD